MITLQLDDFDDGRGHRLGQVLAIAPGLSCVLPASRAFRRPVRIKELTEICAKCGQRLRTWPMLRLSSDHTSPRITFVECECLLIAFEPDHYDIQKLVAGWSDMRRFQNQLLVEFQRTRPEGN
jgi:hypothetical protein